MKRPNLMILFLFAALAVGCGSSGVTPGNGNSAGNSANSPASSPTPTASGPKADVVAASRKFLELKSFTAKISNMMETGNKSEFRFAAPDRFHIISDDSGEVIAIGRKSWVKSASEKTWTSVADGDNSTLGGPRDNFKADLMNRITDVKSEAEEKVAGKEALVYSYKGVTTSGNYPFTARLWVNKATGLPMKLESTFSGGMLKSSKVTYDTDTPVNIEAPK